jgi:hypothetical protein
MQTPGRAGCETGTKSCRFHGAQWYQDARAPSPEIRLSLPCAGKGSVPNGTDLSVKTPVFSRE